MTLGMTNDCEYKKLELEAMKKHNELLDLDIKLRKVKIERRKLALKLLREDYTR